MGKKRRNHPNLEDLLDRPWCYYCERDFEDLKLLISHQKAKHFKCDRCGRRLNTAGGLSVHLNQVHKETLSHVENAIEGRQGLEVEIFGMEGIPEHAVFQHNRQIMQDFQKDRADRQAATGNPPPGLPGTYRPGKKLKIETPEELKKRLEEYRAKGGARQAAAAGPGLATGGGVHAAAAQQQQYPFVPPGVAPPPGMPLPTRPPTGGPIPGAAYVAGGGPGLPQRPGAYAGGLGFSPAGTGSESTLDDLVSHAARGDDIDKIIRMAEAGIKPPAASALPADAAAAAVPTQAPAATTVPAPADKEKEKSKKEKAMRMVYSDGDYSLEEKMAQMPRYALLQTV